MREGRSRKSAVKIPARSPRTPEDGRAAPQPTVFRTFKYRMYPSAEQEESLRAWLRMTRMVYNAAIEHRHEAWRHGRLWAKGSPERKACTVRMADQTRDLTELRSILPEVRDVPYTLMRDTALLRAERAFQAFFRRFREGHGRPRYAPARFWNSLRTEQPPDIRIEGDRLRLPKLGRLKLRLHRPFEGRPRTASIVLEPDGWFAMIGADGVRARSFRERSGRSQAIHLGLGKLMHMGDGRGIGNPEWFRRSEKKLARLQRVLSRRKKGSGRWKAQARLVAKLHRKIARQREHYLHKWSWRLVVRNAAVGVSSWKIRDLIERDDQVRMLRKRISDAAWYKFRRMLAYKAQEARRLLVEVEHEPETQRCSRCGAVRKPPIPLSQKTFDCLSCPHVENREENAWRNVRRKLEEAVKGPVPGLRGADPDGGPR